MRSGRSARSATSGIGALLALALAAACSSAQRDAPPAPRDSPPAPRDSTSDQREATPAPPRATAPVAVTDAFAFYSSPWINLHHFLYQWARNEAGLGGFRPVVLAESDADLVALAPEEQKAWRAALAAYAPLIEKDLLFDDEMWAIKDGLAKAGEPGEPGVELPESVAAPLLAAMPVYRSRFWPVHDRDNRAWIAGVLPLAERHEGRLMEELARAYGGAAPAEPMRVDVTAYANWAGAYTSNGPPHVVIASRDPEHVAGAGLEVLLHEASHTEGLSGDFTNGFQAQLSSAFEAAGAEAPRDLWHVFFFFTAGVLTARVLAEEGSEGYVTYGVRTGLYERVPTWEEQRRVLQEHWKPFLAGELERETALAKIVAALAGAGPR